MHDPLPDTGLVATDGGPPPPVRRLVIGEQPTVALPPLPGTIAPPPAGGGPGGTAPTVRRRVDALPSSQVVERMRTDDLRIAYGGKEAVKGVSLPIKRGEVLGLIGPSGCGKTTLLRSLNRLTELTATATRRGRIFLDDVDVDTIEVTDLRRRVSMVFQQPNPFPMSVFDNVAYALREQGSRRPKKAALIEPVTEALHRAGLLTEVQDNLDHPALRLSGGQQQRLCIARSLAVEPEVVLMDEPASALDPTATARIEELLLEIKKSLTIVIVTHNMQQAARISDRTAFMLNGALIEYGATGRMFTSPHEKLTEDYITGRFG